MKKLLFVLALFSTPVFAQEPAQEPAKETTQEINYYAKAFPSFYAENPGSEIEKKYNAYIRAADANAKALAECKSCNQPPVVRVEGTINVNVRITQPRRNPR
jgi:hypothetical protein